MVIMVINGTGVFVVIVTDYDLNTASAEGLRQQDAAIRINYSSTIVFMSVVWLVQTQAMY